MRSLMALCVFIVFMSAASIQGQEDASFAGFQFNRSLPGARSLGMGGAFVALADDATAAYSNPAGLTLLESPEVALEARLWAVSTVYTARGDARAGSTFQRSEFEFEKAEDHTVSPSFASFVYSRSASRWAVSIYRHELIEYHSRFNSSGVRKSDDEFFGPLDFSTDIEIVNYGVSGSYRLRDNLRLGLGISLYELGLSTRQIVRKPTFTLVAGKEGAGTEPSFNVGVLWNINPEWTLGAAYRRGPRFEMNECFPFSDHLCFQGMETGQQPGGFDVKSEFHVPDQFALGVAFQPLDVLTVTLEVDRIEYSALLEGNRLGQFTVDGKTYAFDLKDANEIRIGAEYMIRRPKGESVSLMLGSWYDPDHTVTFQETGGPSVRLRRAYFQDTGDDEIHISAGIEAKLGRYQMNFAFDHSTRIDTFALSTVVRLH